VADFSGGLIHINSAQRKPYHTVQVSIGRGHVASL
jgi:hypothetical protein